MPNMQAITGNCLCGQDHYKALASPLFQAQCHVWASSRLPSTPVNSDIKDFTNMPPAPVKK